MKETYLSANIETAYIKAWYDEATKRLLCDKYILAWIIISVIDEYKDCSVQYVRGCLIEGDVRTMSETVNPNEVMPAIKGLNTEIQINSEGQKFYTVRSKVGVGKCDAKPRIRLPAVAAVHRKDVIVVSIPINFM